MKNRHPGLVVLLSIVTFGIYAIVWFVMTKIEMNEHKGTKIPTAWLMIIPFVSIYWIWKFSEGVETATNKEISGGLAFVMLFLLSIIGMAIVQSKLNAINAETGAAVA
ncbi:MAG: hypothetical protein ACI9MR_001254 [Myxococcota bacterium]|jgi:hypothetical protein